VEALTIMRIDIVELQSRFENSEISSLTIDTQRQFIDRLMWNRADIRN
jgi:hypothetical protein